MEIVVNFLKRRWETYKSRIEELEPKNDKSFGYLMGGVAAFLGGFAYIHSRFEAAFIWWILALAFILFAFLYPRGLRLLNKLWLFIGIIVETIMNPIIMIVIFYVAVVPFALIFRLLKRDVLSLKKDKRANSYWRKRDTQLTFESFKRQF